VAEDTRATPPADIPAEQQLIGAALLDPDVPARVAIDPTDFYRPAHETIWRALGELNGSHPDRERGLLDLLRARGEFKVGILDAPYIHTCMAAAYSGAAAEQYARAVRQTAKQRKLLEGLRRAVQRIEQVADPILDLDGIAFEAMSDIENVIVVSPTALEATTWEPLDLEAVLAGKELDPPPDILPRTDGQCLLYRGRVHVFAGEPGSGKTFLAAYAGAQEMRLGNRVTFIDYEDRASAVVGRFLSLGVTPDQIRQLFTYQRPALPLTDKARVILERAIAGTTLVIIDGVTEAMTVQGLNLKDNMDIAKFYSVLPRWVADHGPAVVLIDHVVKDEESRGGWALGGGHKIAGTDGVTYNLRIHERMGRGKKGSSQVRIGRDRPGYVEGMALGRIAAVFEVDDTLPDIMLAELRAPEPIPTDPLTGEQRPTEIMHRMSLYLQQNTGLTKTDLVRQVHGKSTTLKQKALNALIREGYVEEVKDGRRIVARLDHPFNPDQETL
jgi:hypothetical protein